MKKVIATKALFLAIMLIVAPRTFVQAQQDDFVKDDDINVADFEDLRYYPLAQKAGIQGVVVVRARLDDQGHVLDAVAISGHELLVRDCLDNLKKWRFRPNTLKSVIVVYNFTLLDGRCKSASSVFSLRGGNSVSIVGCVPTTQ